MATGTRGVIRELVKRKLVDVLITTCGTLDHDVARCWKDYYKGSFIMNDSKLHQEGVNRLGNVLVPNDSYGIIIEQKIQAHATRAYTRKANGNFQPANYAVKSGYAAAMRARFFIGQPKTTFQSLCQA